VDQELQARGLVRDEDEKHPPPVTAISFDPCSAKTSSALRLLTSWPPPPDRGILISWLPLVFRVFAAWLVPALPRQLKMPSSVRMRCWRSRPGGPIPRGTTPVVRENSIGADSSGRWSPTAGLMSLRFTPAGSSVTRREHVGLCRCRESGLVGMTRYDRGRMGWPLETRTVLSTRRADNRGGGRRAPAWLQP
jgi:hypothetical protein